MFPSISPNLTTRQRGLDRKNCQNLAILQKVSMFWSKTKCQLSKIQVSIVPYHVGVLDDLTGTLEKKLRAQVTWSQNAK